MCEAGTRDRLSVNLLPGIHWADVFDFLADEKVNELDSFMYQTVGHTAIDVGTA